MKIERFAFIVISFCLLFLVASTACSSASSTVVTSTPVTSSGSLTASPNTYGVLAASGEAVYKKYGARCHGEGGQGMSGPVLTGSKSGLAKYATAKGLLDYIVKAMPLGAPGSLSRQDYLDITCYLLVENNYVTADAVFDESQLGNILLK